jgi:hypothetical protein
MFVLSVQSAFLNKQRAFKYKHDPSFDVLAVLSELFNTVHYFPFFEFNQLSYYSHPTIIYNTRRNLKNLQDVFWHHHHM